MKKMLGACGLGLLVLGGCAQQAPAPVSDGYARGNSAVAYNYTKSVSPSQKASSEQYTVQSGDSLTQISRHYAVSVDALMDKNDLTSEMLREGQVLAIPTPEEDRAITAAAKQLVAEAATQDVAQPNFTPSVQPAPEAHYSLTQKPKYTLNMPSKEADMASAGVKTDEAISKDMNAIEPAAAKAPVQVNRVATQHKVSRGETLYRIGLQYGVSPFDIMAENDIPTPQDLKAGTTLQIPAVVGVVAPTQTGSALPPASSYPIPQNLPKGMIWPVTGKVIKSFGQKEEGVNHQGINIAVEENTPVKAAENGTVIYADSGLQSYGNLILLRHQNGLVTAYAHNAENLVKRNQTVKKGQVIARAGRSGNVDVSQLHFEVRKNARAVNPSSILPRM